ncbi:reverse transcriptase domain-containing protein [Tanacetum coccineum]
MYYLTSIYSIGNIIDEVGIEDLTIEHYFRLTQESQIPKKVDDMTIAEYLEFEETIKTQYYYKYELHSAKADVPTRYMDHLGPRHKIPDPPLDIKTNPYLRASQSPIHPKIAKTPSKYTREIEEQSNQGLARDDALRKWEAHIDQLRRQEHEVSECMMVHTPKNDVHQKETSQIERISSLPEKPNSGSLTIPYSVDIFNINAIADLGASVNVMSESMLDELSLADPKYANIIVEMADKTREVSLGIKEDRVKIKMNEQECNTAVGEHINKRPTSQAELSHGAVNKTYWCEPVRQEHEKGYTLWESCDPYHEICNGEGIPDKKLKHHWKSTNDDDRINLEWEGLSCTNWVRASKDKDDLEGIIEYLEPILYDGFIDYSDEAYKQRRIKLLGMPYAEPPPIKKEEAEITKYNLGVGEWKKDICTRWASCNPHFDECGGGDNSRENNEYWESSNDDIRTTLEWENLSFDNWVRVAFGKNPEAKRQFSRPARPYSFGNLAEFAAVTTDKSACWKTEI